MLTKIVGILIAIYALTFLVLATMWLFNYHREWLDWFTEPKRMKWFAISLAALLIVAAILDGVAFKDLRAWWDNWR